MWDRMMRLVGASRFSYHKREYDLLGFNTSRNWRISDFCLYHYQYCYVLRDDGSNPIQVSSSSFQTSRDKCKAILVLCNPQVEEALNRIRKYNGMLECLLFHRLRLSPRRQHVQELDRHLITIHEHVSCLFEVVQRAQVCKCVSEQRSFIQIGWRMEQSNVPAPSVLPESKFDMLFALRMQAKGPDRSWLWYDSIASISDMSSFSNGQGSTNGALPLKASVILHVCSNEAENATILHYRGKERVHFQAQRKDASHDPNVLIPLSALLESKRIGRNDRCESPLAKLLPTPLDRRGRWTLAISIASGVIQMCNTPWLRDDWNRSDILVDTLGLRNSFSKVYLSTDSTTRIDLQTYQRELLLSVVQNEVLFTLGLILVELCLGQTLEDMRISQNPPAAPTFLTYWGIAKARMGDVYNEGGALYRDVVYRCIFCKFDTSQPSFEHEAFRQAAWNGVVRPLEEGLKTLWT